MDELTVELYGVKVGVLIGLRGDFDFGVDQAGLEQFGVGSIAVSVAVPLIESPRKSDLNRRRAFFEEVLAEGNTRRQLANLARLDESNTMGLLARYGRDVAGALQIWNPADPDEPRRPEARPVTDAEVVTMFEEVKANPLGNKGRRRLSSLAGVQDKVLLVRTGDGWAEPLDGFASTHILKPQSGKYPSLIFDEEYGSRFARGMGLADFETSVQEIAGRRALVIERYDRGDDGERIHQEDFNQVLGYRGDDKYEGKPDGRLRKIAQVLRTHARGQEQRALARMVTLSAAIGNLDLHAKNISLLHEQSGEVRLAPMYDVVPELHLGLDEELALRVNGHNSYPALTGGDLVAEVESWGVRGASAIVIEALEEVRAIAASEKPHPAADPSTPYIAERQARKLLNSIDQVGVPPAELPADRAFQPRVPRGGWGGPPPSP
ncbi:HipA protein [Microbacterium esteraromaticum]|uniref:HipA protein n=1 Tax=Microbacterium esteraromaticum TaxID=57043 RepID=A0A1R4KN09_9MICO|nr:HipA domain-containing protein [Microbacterium esteraromaticum]SJN45776.1 HipA protein [Microbacterium esteraromaticum]